MMDLVLMRKVFLLVLILVLSKVASSHNEAHTFFIKKVKYQVLNITNWNIIKIRNNEMVFRQHLFFDFDLIWSQMTVIM